MWEVTAYAGERHLREPVETRHVEMPTAETLVAAAGAIADPAAVQALVALVEGSESTDWYDDRVPHAPLVEPIARWAEEAQEAAARNQDDAGQLFAFRGGLAKTYGDALLAYARHDDDALVVRTRPPMNRLRVVYRPERSEPDLQEAVWRAFDHTGHWPWPRFERELEVTQFVEEGIDPTPVPEIVPRNLPRGHGYDVRLPARAAGFVVLKPLNRLRRSVAAETRDPLWRARSRWLSAHRQDDPDLFDLRDDMYVGANVVLVPGLGSTGMEMYEALRPLGVPIAVYDHDTFLPIDQNAAELADLLSRRLAGRPIALICHSRGGLVARAAIDRLHHRADDIHLHTFGTPHCGTPLAEFDRLVPLLRALDATLHPRDLIRSAERYLDLKTLFSPPGVLEMSPENPFITRMMSTLHPQLAFFGSWGAKHDGSRLSWKLRTLAWACSGIVPDPHDLIVEQGSCLGAGDPQGPLAEPATHFDYFSLADIHDYLRYHLQKFAP